MKEFWDFSQMLMRRCIKKSRFEALLRLPGMFEPMRCGGGFRAGIRNLQAQERTV